MSLKSSVNGAFRNASFILGYGSGVFRQARKVPGTPDLIIVTPNVYSFHVHNMKTYPHHYSRLALASPRVVSFLNRTTPYTHYALNASLPSGLICKYGVIGLSDLQSVLTTWSSFYVPGRMQKPIQLVECSDVSTYESFTPAFTQNRLRALKLAASLQTSQHFSVLSLYQTLVGLSYEGDPRMIVAEAPTKVTDIVTGQLTELEEIYRPLFSEAGIVVENDSLKRTGEHDGSAELRRLRFLNRAESAIQAVKGIFTNPVSQSVSYFLRKISKRLG